MIISFKAKNIVVLDNFEIDFLVYSKKTGNYVRNNDFFINENMEIQKRIGIIGANSSGKSSIFKSILLFNNFFNISNLFRMFYEKNIFQLHAEKILKSNDTKNKSEKIPIKIVNELMLFNPKSSDVNKNELLSRIKDSYEHFFSSSSFDSNKNIIGFEIKFFYEKKITVANYLFSKNGVIEYSFKQDGKEIFKDKINFFELDPYSNIQLTYKNWKLNLYYIFFEPNLDFDINNNSNFLMRYNDESTFFSMKKIILPNIFDFIKKNRKKTNHFLKWVRIADLSVKKLAFDAKNKVFIIQKENESISFNNLSLGTKKWIILYYFLFIAIKRDNNATNLIIYDEIENSFHNRLISTFFNIFDEKIKNSQMIFTSHNPEIFKKTFRHDGIYLSNQNENKCSLIRLDKLKLDKNIAIGTIYLNEQIGSHPDDQAILDFYTDDYDE